MNLNGLKLLSSRAINKLGDVLYDYGNSTWIASMGSLGQKFLGIYQIAELLVSIVLNPFGGALADRFKRRKILLVTDGLCAIICLGISFIGNTQLLLYGLIAANVILAISSAFSGPAYKSYIPEVVDKTDIVTYNSNLETVVQIIKVSSPVVGFFIFNHLGIRLTLVIDALTFFLSFLCLYAIKLETEEEVEPTNKSLAAKAIVTDILEGFTYIKKEKEIFFLLVIAALVNTFIAMFNYLLPFTNHLFKDSSAYASLLSLAAVGSIIGALVARKVKNSMSSLLWMLAFSGLGMMVISLSPLLNIPVWLSYSGNLLFEGFLTIFNIHFFSQVQLRVAKAYMGRVISTIFTIAILFMPLGTLTMTLLPVALSVTSFMVLGSAIFLMSMLALIYVRRNFS